jgi:VWFA-related protein
MKNPARKLSCSCLVLLLMLAPQIDAQDDQSFSSRANLVSVPTLVTNANRRIVPGLQAKDFIIEDDGVPQTVHLADAAENEPVSLMIAVQCGRRAKKEFGRMEGISSMLDPILSSPDNEAAVLFFDSKLKLARDFTSNADAIEKELENLPSGDGGAAILDAIAYSARLLAKRDPGRKLVLLLISDTRDHGSIFTNLDTALTLIGANNISVYALPFSPYISEQLDTLRGTNTDEWSPVIDLRQKLLDIREAMRKNIPKTLTQITGGEYEQFATRNGFEDDLIAFTNHLHARYELSFEPKNPHPGLHQIRVRLRNPIKDASVLYRTTYWAESPRDQPR